MSNRAGTIPVYLTTFATTVSASRVLAPRRAVDRSVLWSAPMTQLNQPLRLRYESPELPPTLRLAEPPPTPGAALLWSAAVEADAASGAASHVSRAWDDLVDGRLRLWCENTTLARTYLLARLVEPHERPSRGLNPGEAWMVARVLSGEQQKVLASELGIAPSTVSSRFVRALARIDLGAGPASLPLVVLAQAAASVVQTPHPRCGLFEHQGSSYRVLSVPRPVTGGMSRLTRAEREVARLLVEGCSRLEIARRRGSSVHTVGRQINSVFSALDVPGRYALIRRAIELGCFA